MNADRGQAVAKEIGGVFCKVDSAPIWLDLKADYRDVLTSPAPGTQAFNPPRRSLPRRWRNGRAGLTRLRLGGRPSE